VISRRVWVGVGFALTALAAPVARAATATSDSLGVAAPVPAWSIFDVIPRDEYLGRHAVSLDNFLEFTPGGLLVRPGPIGVDASYARWGIGRGRAALTSNGIPLNDPQNGVAPWVHVATSGLGTLSFEPVGAWIEGGVDLVDRPPPKAGPHTFLELSKGTNELRQRRVRFASEDGPVGIDLSYDEVLDNGYNFDATGGIIAEKDFGNSETRNSSIVLRGHPDDDVRFDFGVRQFQGVVTGTLSNTKAELRKSGHVVWLDAGVGKATLTVFGRGYTSERPESSTTNETAGIVFDMRRERGRDGMRLRVRGENTSAVQDLAGAHADSKLARVVGDVGINRQLGNGTEVFASGSAAGDNETPLAWGASAGARAFSARSTVSLVAQRSFRLPTLGEYYLPAHIVDGRTLVGSAGVDPETAFELRGDWELKFGPAVNLVRASWIRAGDAIALRPRAGEPATWRVASNGTATPAMTFVEDRLRMDASFGPLTAVARGSVMASTGDREDAFASVPTIQVNASGLIGGAMFEKTSALYGGVEYMHVGPRDDYNGAALPAFDVLNVVVEGRLINTHFYLKFLNVLDEAYTTTGNYLMTPYTFEYGIEWTLFN
jgi:hypothetical protein